MRGARRRGNLLCRGLSPLKKNMTYTIGQVEDLTGVKSHVLRYWEEVVPGFTPQKDVSGRRLYTQKEVELIFRLKYLITEKKYTAEGAGQRILEEAQLVQDNADLIQQIRQCRAELSELYILIRNSEGGIKN